MAQARLREALNAGSGTQKEKGPPVADGILSVTPDTQEALEWRSKRSIIDSAGASSSYTEDESGPKPSELYGKFTWKIENFSEVNKRELRSAIFEVGSYKWYILVYPQGCDVCHHLSLFLCVADYDKLLPGWSHFAQFTIAVVNKDPKKSKYSDTLHRFCKKEHDWGWKKFMELNKVLEGFTVSNTLVIKAQVQVIRDRPTAPFRCLEAQYRRELVRVYLSNVETLARKFVEEKHGALAALRADDGGFLAFWASLEPRRRRQMAAVSGEVILKGVVKRFFNEKEVTSTLVMDALVSGVKQIEEYSRLAESKKGKKDKDKQQPLLSLDAERNEWTLRSDLVSVIECSLSDSFPAGQDDGKPAEGGLAVRNAQDVEDYSSNYVERDERRLADLGRRAVEVYAVSHILRELESVHSMEESIKRQDALIKEEEENESLEAARTAARTAADRDKRMRKKERQREKKAAEQAKKDAEDEGRRALEAARRAQAEEKAAAEASVLRQQEHQREAESRAALRERAQSQRAQEASRQQEAAEADAKAKLEEQAKLERQERPAAQPSENAEEPSTAGPAKLSRASSDDEPSSELRRPNGTAEMRGSEDGVSSSTGQDVVGSSSADTSDYEDTTRLEQQTPSQARRQPGTGVSQSRVEYLQAELAASNSALATARGEVSKLQRELSVRSREASESAQQLAVRTREVNERCQEIVQLQATVAELRQQVAVHEQQKAAAAPSVVTLGDLRDSMSDVDISVGSQPASRASSLDASSMDQQQLAQARAAAQTANMHKVRTGGTSQSLDSPSDSPHTCREANQSAEVGSASGSYVSSSSHRQGHAWAHAEQQGQHGRLNGQRAAPGPRPRAAVASQGNGNAKDSSAALAAASAAAAAALRGPGRGAGHAGPGGANGAGQGPSGQQHSQPMPIGSVSDKAANHKMLNGNAVAFHPSSGGTPNGRVMAESPTGNGMHSRPQPKNAVISYRNAAAGANNGHMAASSPRQRGQGFMQGHQPHAASPMTQQKHHQPPPPPSGPHPQANAHSSMPAGQPSPPAQHTLNQGQEDNASGMSRGNSDASSHTANGVSRAGGNMKAPYEPAVLYATAPAMHGLSPQQPTAAQAYTPLPEKKQSQSAPTQESPGLDDFAHMGMITNLLE